MTITATVKIGTEFGAFGGKDVTEAKVFTTIADYERWLGTMRQFDAEDEIVSVKWDCK